MTRLGRTRLFVAPALVVLAAFAAYTTAYLVYLSMSEYTASTGRPRFVGLANYVALAARDPFFWQSALKSIAYTASALGVELTLGTLLALLYWRSFPGARLFRTLTIVPMTLPPVVVGLSWRILFDPDLGLLNQMLRAVGIEGPAWVADPRTALGSLVLVDVWQWTPFMMLTIGAGLAGLPAEPMEAAALDGAGRLKTFFWITLPMLREVVVTAALFRTIDLFKAFDTLQLITGGGPGTSTETLHLYAYRVFQQFNIGYASAIAVVLVAVTIAATNAMARTAARTVS